MHPANSNSKLPAVWKLTIDARGKALPVEVKSSERTEAISVPYPSFVDESRNNRGFVDVRGRPDLAAEIAECGASKKLQILLVRLASSSSSLFSIGCDLGHHIDRDAPKGRRRAAGGYLHLTSSLYNDIKADHWARLCNSVADVLKQTVHKRDEWDVTFTLAPVMINLDRYHKLTGSISIAFFAWAKAHQDALSSRERLIATLDEGLADETVRSAFGIR